MVSQQIFFISVSLPGSLLWTTWITILLLTLTNKTSLRLYLMMLIVAINKIAMKYILAYHS